jgi:hypothetical protein
MVERLEFGEVTSATSDKGISCTTDSPNRMLRFNFEGGNAASGVNECETQAETIRTPNEELRRLEHNTAENTVEIIRKNRRNEDVFRDRLVAMASDWIL